MYITDKSKGDGKLTRPFFDRHLPVVNFQTGNNRCQRAAPPLREDVAAEQDQGGCITPALGTSTALNGALQTALGLTVQNVVKNLEIVQRRSTGWIKGLENMLCSQTSFLGHNLLKTSQRESEVTTSLSLQWLSILMERTDVFAVNHKNYEVQSGDLDKIRPETRNVFGVYYYYFFFFNGDTNFFKGYSRFSYPKYF